MKKKSLKKTMVIVLAGIMLAGSLGWSQIPARAATNGEVICEHSKSRTERNHAGYMIFASGHMEKEEVAEWCDDKCKKLIRVSFEYGDLEAHDFSTYHDMIEDLHNGLYMHWIMCSECGYEDEVLSDDPDDPKM